MSVIGISLTKVLVEKKEPLTGKIHITNNIGVKDVFPAELHIGEGKQSALRFVFNFIVNYNSEEQKLLSTIDITGEVLVIEDKAKTKEVLDNWNKNKVVVPDVLEQVLSSALNKATVHSIIYSQDFNLLPPVQLPKVQITQSQQQPVQKKLSK